MKTPINPVLAASGLALSILLGGCASTATIDELRADIQAAQSDADAARQEAAEAKRTASEAKSLAEQANMTADEALRSTRETDMRIDRMFKKTMQK